MAKKKEQDDWREELRGTYGNTGRMSRAGYNLGGLGAGEGQTEEPAEEMEAAASEQNQDENEENRPSHLGRWSENFGPRGYSGGFSGRQYSWRRRGDRGEAES